MNNNNLKDRIDNKIESLLNDVAEEQGFLNYKIEKAPGSMKGDGYLGLITAVFITGSTSSGKNKTLHLIVKSASKTDAVRIEMPIEKAFEREIYMYDTIIPAFCNFEKERSLQPFSGSAKCYKTCMINKSEALILDNLKETGYSVCERRTPLEHDHVRFVMAEYGRLHAISIAMKDQELERYKKLTDNMYDIFDLFVGRGVFLQVFKNRSTKAIESLDPISDKQAYDVYKKFLEDNLEEFLKNVQKYVDNYSVILHGDCWTNNMLFKYEDKENTKKPTKMCLIDLQTSRIGPTAFDLSYFLYSCASKKVLDNHEYYLEVYYNSLSVHLQKLGSNPKEVYPRSVFQENWQKYSRFGLICSMLLIHVMLTEHDEVADLTEIAELGKDLRDAFDYDLTNSEAFNDRARHIILHFVNNGYI